MNKYLEKLASRSDKALNAVFGWGDRLIGHSAGRANNIHNSLKSATHLGDGIPRATLNEARENAERLSRASRNTRIRTGLTIGGLGTAGYLGIHKYQQHKDNKIMEKILSNAQKSNIQ